MINGLNLYRERIIDYEKRILRTAILSTILLSACSINFGADNKMIEITTPLKKNQTRKTMTNPILNLIVTTTMKHLVMLIKTTRKSK